MAASVPIVDTRLQDVGVGDATDTLDEALWAGRFPLFSEWAPTPATYLFFYVGSLPLYAPLTADCAAGTWPIYIGSTRDLRDRMSRHRRTLLTAVDVTADDLVVAALPRPSLAHALFAEHLLLEILETILWNQTWLAGFGSRPQGARRRGRLSPWRTLHADAAPTRQTERAVLTNRVSEFLRIAGAPLRAWPALDKPHALDGTLAVRPVN